MTRDRRGRAHADETAVVGEAEGCLKAWSYQFQARAEAEILCSRLPWMTSSQAEDVRRHYVEQRLTLTRQTLLHHVDDLRGQYENRYRNLRRDLLKRHAVGACAVLAVCVGVHAAGCVLWR